MRKRIYSKINRKFDNLQTSFFIRTEPTTRDNLTRGATNTVGRGFSPRREHDPSLISARGSGKIILPCPLPVIRGCSSQTLPPRDCRESRLHCRYGFAPFPKEFDFNLYYIMLFAAFCLLCSGFTASFRRHRRAGFFPVGRSAIWDARQKYNDPTPEMGVGSSIYLIN